MTILAKPHCGSKTRCNLWQKLRALFTCDCRPEAQPRPLATRIARDLVDDGWRTAIARIWRPQDVARCKLCPNCMASPDGLCLIIARRHVADKDAPLYVFNPGKEQAETAA